MSAPELLVELDARGVRLTAHGDRPAYDAPAGVMTPELRDRLKGCKGELLALLTQTVAPEAPAQLESRADTEWRRFLAVCRPRPDGRGWYDPAQAAAIDALARADAPPPPAVHSQARRDAHGLTTVERAELWRAQWKVSGYPPGVRSCL